LWAFCKPTLVVSVHQEREGDPTKLWKVENTYSTKPSKRCQDESIEDPLLEPQKVSGGFVKYTEEATEDRNGVAIKSSSHEMFRGAQVEFDANRPTVRIEQNTARLGLATFTEMIDTVNDRTLWGLAARKIKLSNITWSRNLYGQCNFYFTRNFEFDINFNTFDRKLIDEGTKVLNPDLVGADKDNPKHFIRYKDANDENTRVILDGNGNALTDGANPVEITIEKYEESNFLLLGIPTNLEAV